jgi:hypothetical protein
MGLAALITEFFLVKASAVTFLLTLLASTLLSLLAILHHMFNRFTENAMGQLYFAWASRLCMTFLPTRITLRTSHVLFLPLVPLVAAASPVTGPSSVAAVSPGAVPSGTLPTLIFPVPFVTSIRTMVAVVPAVYSGQQFQHRGHFIAPIALLRLLP